MSYEQVNDVSNCVAPITNTLQIKVFIRSSILILLLQLNMEFFQCNTPKIPYEGTACAAYVRSNRA